MGQALYRKHRPKKLSEIVGQEHITTALQNALKNGTISHAYLLTGPRGVGKTSVARILAHEVNNLPYDDDTTHLDIIEIDAASNRRIDEIRELREKVHNAPASTKYKVYIIDEVHMLTKEAFNALLKTLEEPPEHAIFILATTEAHKVPETIISRTQRFTFKPIQDTEAVEHLRSIAKAEQIKIDDDALALLASHAGGSFRDSISLLDQVKATGEHINLDMAQRLLGIAPEELITDLLAAVQSGNAVAVIAKLGTFQQQGFQAAQLAHQLSVQLRQEILESSSLPLTVFLQRLLEVPAAHNPGALLELVLLEQALSAQPEQPPQFVEPPLEVEIVEQAAEEPQEAELEPEPASTPTPSDSLDAAAWQQALQAIKRRHNTLYGIARMAAAEFQGDQLILRFRFPFHQKRLDESKNRQLISDIIHKQTGQVVEIRCVVDKDAPQPETTLPSEVVQESAPIDTISNIFGPSEVLES